MANVLKLAITGLEHFHPQYGKLIGTGKKNGIQVFEQLNGSQRVLTSVKDGIAIKQVAQKRTPKDGYDVTTTEARNFVTGDRIKIERGINTTGEGEKEYSEIYRNITKQDAAGNWDELRFSYSKKGTDKPADLKRKLAKAQTYYASYDVENGKFVEYDFKNNYADLIAGQRDVKTDALYKIGGSDGSIEAAKASKTNWYKLPEGDSIRIGQAPQLYNNRAEYVLPNGAKIPEGVNTAFVRNWTLGKERFEYSPYNSNTKSNMEQNLGDAVFNFFDRLVCKLKGVKLPEA